MSNERTQRSSMWCIPEHACSYRGLQNRVERERQRERCKIPCPLQRPTALLPWACTCSLRGWFWSWVGLLPDNQEVWDRSQFAFWHAVWLWAHHSTSLFSGGGEKISLPSPSQRNLFRLKKSLRCTSCDVISCYMWEHKLVKRQPLSITNMFSEAMT